MLSEGCIPAVVAHACNNDSRGVHVEGSAYGYDGYAHSTQGAINMDVADNACNSPIGTTHQAINVEVNVVPKELHNHNIILPVDENQTDTTSSDTLLLPSYGGYSSSLEGSIIDTELISSMSHTLSDSVDLSKGKLLNLVFFNCHVFIIFYSLTFFCHYYQL